MAASSNPACAVPNQMQMVQGQPVAEVKLLLAPKPLMYQHLTQLPYLLQEGLPGDVQVSKPDATTLFWVKPEQGCGGQALLTPQIQEAIQPVIHSQQPSSLPAPPQPQQPVQHLHLQHTPQQQQPQQQEQQQPQEPPPRQQQVSQTKSKAGGKERSQSSSKSNDGISPWVLAQGSFFTLKKLINSYKNYCALQ